MIILSTCGVLVLFTWSSNAGKQCVESALLFKFTNCSHMIFLYLDLLCLSTFEGKAHSTMQILFAMCTTTTPSTGNKDIFVFQAIHVLRARSWGTYFASLKSPKKKNVLESESPTDCPLPCGTHRPHIM